MLWDESNALSLWNGGSDEFNLREVEDDDGIQGLKVKVNEGFQRFESVEILRIMIMFWDERWFVIEVSDSENEMIQGPLIII